MTIVDDFKIMVIYFEKMQNANHFQSVTRHVTSNVRRRSSKMVNRQSSNVKDWKKVAKFFCYLFLQNKQKNVYDRRRFFPNELHSLEKIDDLMGWLSLSTKRRRSAKTFKKWIRSYTIASDRKYRRSSTEFLSSTNLKRFGYDRQIKNSPSCPIIDYVMYKYYVYISYDI